VNGGFYQGPASPNPVTVATIDKFVGASTKTTLGGILTRREPRDKAWHVEVSSFEYQCKATCHKWRTPEWMENGTNELGEDTMWSIKDGKAA
jgi:hypothetical protein